MLAYESLAPTKQARWKLVLFVSGISASRAIIFSIWRAKLDGLDGGVNDRPIFWLRNGLAVLSSGSEPGFLGKLDFLQCRLRRLAERRASFQVRDVSDISAIGIAVKNVDVVIFHDGSSSN